MCIKEVIDVKQHNEAGWVVALGMDIYKSIDVSFEYYGLSCKNR